MYPIAYASFWSSFFTPLYDLVITIIAVVIGELAVYSFLKSRERPKVSVKPITDVRNKVGFFVSMTRGNIMGARVRCNERNCFWENEEGRKDEKKDLLAGDAPSLVFPFQAFIEWQPNTSNILINIKEIVTDYPDGEKIIFAIAFPAPLLPPTQTNATSLNFNMRFQPKTEQSLRVFDASLRIIGQGIEEKRDYCVSAFLKGVDISGFKNGKPDLEHVTVLFTLRKKKRFRVF